MEQMEQRINIAELLKDCPSGMELDCTMWDSEAKVFLKRVLNDDFAYPIEVTVKYNNIDYSNSFNKYGAFNNLPYCKCVILPKGKTTWEGFQRPFKDGDIVVTTLNNIAIIKEHIWSGYLVHTILSNNLLDTNQTKVDVARLATEEEKQKLFDAIKSNGYRWNEETKTLEKLIKPKLPKFKVGDRIKDKNVELYYTVRRILGNSYILDNNLVLDINREHFYELVSNKFDINTLKPFESKVLVRDVNGDNWIGAFYSHYKSELFYVIGNVYYYQCIPYEGNEHLLGTNNDCDEFYKNW